MRCATALATLTALVAATAPLEAQSQDDIARLNRAVDAYYRSAKYAMARAILDTIIARDSTLRASGNPDGAGLSNYGNPYIMSARRGGNSATRRAPSAIWTERSPWTRVSEVATWCWAICDRQTTI